MDSADPTGLSRRQLLLASAALSIGTASSAAWAQPAAGKRSVAPAQAIIAQSQEPTNFNPLMVGLEVDFSVWWNVYNPLWMLDPQGNFIPVLVKEVPSIANGGISADGLEWRIKLRENVKWHDGRDFRANDVKFTLELLKNPKFRAANRTKHQYVDTVTVVSDHELTFKLSRPFAPYLSVLAWTFIVPAHVLADAPDPNASPLNVTPIGTGPYRFASRKTGELITLTRNAAYFGEPARIETLVYRYVPDMNVMYTHFRTGLIDHIGYMGIPADKYAEAKTFPERSIYVSPTAAVENITLNHARPYFAEKTCREALYLAIDKNAIIDSIYYGIPKPVETFIPQQNWAFNPELPKHRYDPERAKKLLDEAGWKPGPDGVRQKNGVRFEFENSTTSGNQLREQAQQLMIQDLAKIGIVMKINNMPGAVIWGKFWSESRFDSLMTSTTFTIAADPDVTHRFGSGSIPVKTNSGSNVSQYENPKLDALLEEAVRAIDLGKRKELYCQVQTLIREELVLLPLFQTTTIEGAKAALRGFQSNVNLLGSGWNASSWHWQA